MTEELSKYVTNDQKGPEDNIPKVYPIPKGQEWLYDLFHREYELLENIKELEKNNNSLLEFIRQNQLGSLEKSDEEDYQVKARIMDFDMSIGSMINLSFKWLVASIPIGLTIGVIYVVIVLLITR